MTSSFSLNIQKQVSCKNCDPIIILLTQQINQLNNRQTNLKKVNHTLTKALTKSKQNSQHQYIMKVDWKKKYEEQISKTYDLQKQIKFLEMDCSFSRTDNQIFNSNSNNNSHHYEQKTVLKGSSNYDKYLTDRNYQDKQNLISEAVCKCKYNMKSNEKNQYIGSAVKSSKKHYNFLSNQENQKSTRCYSLKDCQKSNRKEKQNTYYASSIKDNYIQTTLKQSRKKSMKKMQTLMENIIKKRQLEDQMNQYFQKKKKQQEVSKYSEFYKNDRVHKRRSFSSTNLNNVRSINNNRENTNEIVVRIIDQRQSKGGLSISKH